VSKTNSEQLLLFDSRQWWVRILLVLAVILALIFCWFAVRWQIGNLLASGSTVSDPNVRENAAMAAVLAPSDPQTQWLLATIEQSKFSDDNYQTALAYFEKAVQLSPNDYRQWIELARAREQAGNIAGGEKSYQRSIELAPAYAFPRWQYGNFLLRAGRSGEAFEQLRKAAETSSRMRQQVFYLAWETFGKDPTQIEQAVGNTMPIRAGLAAFYGQKGLGNDALRMWNSLTEAEKEENRQSGELALQKLYENKQFRAALNFAKQLKTEEVTPEAEKVQNAGFESDIGDQDKTNFGWKVTNIKQMDVRLDPGQKKEGKRSLRLAFSGYSQVTLQNIWQFVVVEPNSRYRLTFFLRTSELKSAGPPLLEVGDVESNKTLASTAPFPLGTNDWQQVRVDFSTPSKSDAVLIRTSRSFCGENCPIVGTVWYDDFNLQKLK
jgi:hypothetical protein